MSRKRNAHSCHRLSKSRFRAVLQEKKDGKVVEWMEKVSDEQYQARLRAE